MTLLYEAGRWTLNGERATVREVNAYRDDQVTRWANELGLLAIEDLGDPEPSGVVNLGEAHALVEFPESKITRFAGRFLVRVGEMVTSAYTFAAGGIDKLTSAQWNTVADLVANQTSYGRGFMTAIRNGELTAAQVVARASLYAGAAVTAFEHGKTSQVDFLAPAQPGEGCDGLTNCRCWWEIEEYDDRWEGTWNAVGDANTCTTCGDRAAMWAPLVQPK